MTSFKLLTTLLSIALLATAHTMPALKRAETCDPAACTKAVVSVAPAVAGCVEAGESLAKLNEDDDDDDKRKQAPADAAKAAAQILDCVAETISAAADLSKDCSPCLNSIGGQTSAPATPAATPRGL